MTEDELIKLFGTVGLSALKHSNDPPVVICGVDCHGVPCVVTIIKGQPVVTLKVPTGLTFEAPIIFFAVGKNSVVTISMDATGRETLH